MLSEARRDEEGARVEKAADETSRKSTWSDALVGRNRQLTAIGEPEVHETD